MSCTLMCYYREGQMRGEVWLCRDHDTEDGSTAVRRGGGEEPGDLATLLSCRVAGFVAVAPADQQHPRQFSERRRLPKTNISGLTF